MWHPRGYGGYSVDEAVIVPGLTHALEEPQPTPLRALRAYPQGWLLGLTMLALSATWTAIVTFLPTLLLEQHGMPPARSGPLLGCLYYGLIPCVLLGGVLEKRVQHRKLLLWVPALCNTLLGVLITYTSAPWLLIVLLTGVGVLNGIAFELARTPGADPNVARAVFDAGSAVIAAASFGFVVFFGAASCSAARSGALPPWAYWAGSLVTVAQALAGLALVAKTGFFATGEAMPTFVAPTLALLWVVTVSVVIVRRDGVPPVARTEP